MVGEERKTPRKEGEILRMKHTTLTGNLQEEMRAPASHLRERETKMIQRKRKTVRSKKTGEGVATEAKEDMKVVKERMTVVRGRKEPKGGTGR